MFGSIKSTDKNVSQRFKQTICNILIVFSLVSFCKCDSIVIGDYWIVNILSWIIQAIFSSHGILFLAAAIQWILSCRELFYSFSVSFSSLLFPLTILFEVCKTPLFLSLLGSFTNPTNSSFPICTFFSTLDPFHQRYQRLVAHLECA